MAITKDLNGLSFDFKVSGIPNGKVTLCYWVVSVLIDGNLYYVEDVYANDMKVTLTTSPLKSLKIDSKDKAKKFAKLIMSWDYLKYRSPSGLFIHKVWTEMKVEDTIEIFKNL